MKSVFTIVAKNYIGLAKVLRQSMLEKNEDVSFYIFVADEQCDEYEGEKGVLFAKDCVDIDRKTWIDMSFKYSLTEFCTAIKPFCFKYLFERVGVDSVIYLDPDIYVFNNLNCIFDILSNKSIVLVPHIVQPFVLDERDKVFLQSGIYNLGFLGLARTSTSYQMLEWWGKKLISSCFDDVLDYTFTDQKWMNYIPALFPEEEVCVSRHLGANIAPWNFYEREIILKEGVPFEVVSRLNKDKYEFPVLFIHYSGFDYKGLLQGVERRTRFGIYDMQYNDVKEALSFYVNQLNKSKDEMLKYLSLKYSYSTYDNGFQIDKFQRRLYRSLSNREVIDNPFLVSSSDFYERLKKKNLIRNFGPESKVSQASSVKGKLKLFNLLMSVVYRILGYKRYIAFLRLLKYFSRFESQIFLIDSKYRDSSVDLLIKK